MDARPLRRLLQLTSALILIPFAGGCGSSSINVDAPSGAKCQVSASSSISSAPASGGTGTVAVTTTRDCTWTATTAVSWITFTSATTGQGSGAVDFRVGVNAERTTRRGALAVNDTQITIEQAPAPCTYAVSPANSSIGAAGGAITVQVTAGSGCIWTTASNAEWLTVTGGGTASGPATITAAPNTGPARTGTVTIAGQTVTVSQIAATCTFTISPTSSASPASGGNGSVNVTMTAGANCGWTAASNASWITVTNGASGTGNGTVDFSVAANAGPARSGTATIAGQTFTVSQAAAPAPCTFAIAPTSQSVPASGGTASVSITTESACAWTTTSNVVWITISSGASGTGNGTVELAIATNGGAARTGTVMIGGQTLTVSQAAAACAFTIAPTNSSMPAAGGNGNVSVTVTAGANCAWTATSNASWITVTGSGTGNGTVAFAVAVNTGTARSGTATIAGQTFTVAQEAPCTYAITPTSQLVVAAGGNASVNVTAGNGCAWTATSNAPWIAIAAGASGSGNGTVALSIALNDGAARSGTVTIAGQTFTVTQDAALAPSTFAIASVSQSVP